MYKCYLTLIISLLAFLPPGARSDEIYRPDDSCLKMVYPDDHHMYDNPDSIRADSCINSPTYEQFYAKIGYIVGFSVYPFTKIPISTTEKVTWEGISDEFPTIKLGFKQIEEKFGKFVFFRVEENDTNIIKIPYFGVCLDHYNPIDSISDNIENIDSVLGCVIEHWFGYNSGDVVSNKERKLIELGPNPTDDILKIYLPDSYLTTNMQVEIFDLVGNSLRKMTFHPTGEIYLSVKELLPGFYFLKINNYVTHLIKN